MNNIFRPMIPFKLPTPKPNIPRQNQKHAKPKEKTRSRHLVNRHMHLKVSTDVDGEPSGLSSRQEKDHISISKNYPPNLWSANMTFSFSFLYFSRHGEGD
jgi:hypothetical protein